MEVRKPGKPTVMTENVLALLREAFEWGCPDIEACLHAGISQDALYDYQKRNPGYAEQKERLKKTPSIAARKTVVASVKEDSDMALKYLERKEKQEFSPRSEHTGADGKDLLPTPILGNINEQKE